MSSLDEQILRASKEIVVKFIETGRISPNGFPEIFKTVYQTIEETVNKLNPVQPAGEDTTSEKAGK